ncbi:MAG: diaminopimelate epimerase [Bryobacterales bacterium]|nr:diaminopimelate epimerase [Bryobacterales bacterium]
MPQVRFAKAHGAGNDFLIVERRDLAAIGVGAESLPGFAARICDRRFGIGADGLEVVSPAGEPQAIAELRLWNSDGSAAEISGNGTRCVAAYLTQTAGAPERFAIETGAGVREIERTLAKPPYYEFRMTTDESECRVLDCLPAGQGAGLRGDMTAVHVGNPQLVVRVERLDFDWQAWGPILERDPCFPAGANVSFMTVGGNDRESPALEVRFWERGAGATLSSGTGSLGAAFAARHRGWIADRARILAEGGEMSVEWRDGMRLTGPAVITARGSYEVG